MSCLLALAGAGCARGTVAAGEHDAVHDGAIAPADDLDGGLEETAATLLGAPLVFAPTGEGFHINAVMGSGAPSSLRARVAVAGTASWGADTSPTSRGSDVAEWTFAGLAPGTRYTYKISEAGTTTLYTGSAVTQRPPGQAFTFALITDPHIGADLTYSNQGSPDTLRAVSAAVGQAAPDFMVNLGDKLDFHEYGFNEPPPSGDVTRQAYLNYRGLLGDTLGRLAHFGVIGNWDGENGTFTADQITVSRQTRMLYLPGPDPASYPESGSPNQDYYAFTWGDALFVVLNVMTYTTTEHLLGGDPGLPDDWTLGPEQLAWFANTLANATSKWRFVLIHHAVGGAAGDAADSAYGRGGGQAAHVGEQATIHQWMLQYGVQIFFYGHDHVFTDMQVDGIHYTLPGSAGSIWPFPQAQTGYTQSWLVSGWSQVTVTPTSTEVRFIQMDGSTIYAYTLL